MSTSTKTLDEIRFSSGQLASEFIKKLDGDDRLRERALNGDPAAQDELIAASIS